MRRKILVGLCLVLGLGLTLTAQLPAPLQLGTIAATDATVVGEITSSASVAIQVSGTWSGTMAFEASVDQQVWASVPVIRQSTSALVTSTTSNDTFSIQNPGYGWIRVRGSVYTSGLAVVSMRGGFLATTNPPTPTQPGRIAVAQGAVTTDITAYPSAAIQVSGTWSGTLIFEASVDSRAWATLQVAKQSTGAVVTTTTVNDTFGMFNPGFAWVRVRCSSYSSGAAIVSIRGGYNVNTPVSVTTVGSMWKRTGTTIAPVVSGDAVTVDGLLTASAAIASTTGTFTTAVVGGDIATQDVLKLLPLTSATRFTGNLTVADLTADKTWTFPNTTGTVALVDSQIFTTNVVVGAIATQDVVRVLPNTSATRFTGTITPADLTADATWTFPALTGTVALMGVANVGTFSASTSVSIGVLTNADGMFYAGGNGAVEFVVSRANDAATSPRFTFIKSRGTQAARTDVVDGDMLFDITGMAYSGGQAWNTAAMQVIVDGTFTSNTRPPSRIELMTNTANGAQTVRFVLDKSGDLTLGTTGGTGTGNIFAGTYYSGTTAGIDKTCTGAPSAQTVTKGIITAMTCSDPTPDPAAMMAEIQSLKQQVSALQASGGTR